MKDEIPANSEGSETNSKFQSLKELIDFINGRNLQVNLASGDAGYAEHLPFPFLGLVGQSEMKMALLLALINPAIGGVLLIGPRGTGKTTAVRSLLDLLPQVERSTCFYGCLPEDIESGGLDAVCPECAKKYGEGKSFTMFDQVRLVELPLNATLDDVIGSIDKRSTVHGRQRVKRGLLAQADQNIIYIDEINLLSSDVANALLDAAAQGTYTIRRGSLAATYRSRITLIGSMNPEEGNLRPQILDRFGLKVIVKGLNDPEERMEVYRRYRSYLNSPRQMIAQYREATEQACHEIQHARALLPSITVSEKIAQKGIEIIQALKIDSSRSEIAFLETARAYAAADGRSYVEFEDLRAVSLTCLRMRHSQFIEDYLLNFDKDEKSLIEILDQVIPVGDTGHE